jgi:hypothetical protein
VKGGKKSLHVKSGGKNVIEVFLEADSFARALKFRPILFGKNFIQTLSIHPEKILKHFCSYFQIVRWQFFVFVAS